MTKILLTFLTLTLFCSNLLFGQRIEKIEVPNGIVYNYCDSLTFEKAKRQVQSDLSPSDDYSLISAIMFVAPSFGPALKKSKS
jgi:hypothetical protein